MQTGLRHDLGQAARARGDHREPRRHRLQRGQRQDLLVARRDQRDGRARPQPRQLRGVHAAGEADVASHAAQCRRLGPSPATTSGTPALRHAAIASATPFSGVRRPA